LMAVVDDAAACVGEAHREIRVLSYLLHPPQLLSQGLAEALGSFARGFGMRARIQIEVDVDRSARTIDDETAVQLFRICQEALTNVYRHASARTACVVLDIDKKTIRLTVKDDGVGIDLAATDGILGLGLSGMRERIARLGGAFAISSHGDGTELIVSLPYRSRTAGAQGDGRLGNGPADRRNIGAV